MSECDVCQSRLNADGDCEDHEECRMCDGEGSVMIAEARTYDPDTATPEEWDECPQCAGFGWVDTSSDNLSPRTKEDDKWELADLKYDQMKERL